MSTTRARRLYAIGAEFESAKTLYHAAESIRDEGFKKWDVHTPFPIHGMDKAMGLGRSVVSKLVFVGGITGAFIALALQYYTSVIDYPLVVQGKPTNFFTLPAFFPITFELTVLFAAITAVTSMLLLNRLPRWHHPLFNWELFGKATDNGFFAVIESTDPNFDEVETRALLERVGGRNVTLVYDEED